MSDPHALAANAASELSGRWQQRQIDFAMILGSGWSPAGAKLGTTLAEAELDSLPGFHRPVVAGHGGAARLIRTAAGKTGLIFTGRTHLYEGRGVAAVVHGVRTAAALGASLIVLTNGCGGLRPEWQPGTPVLIRDHLNLTGVSPLVGARFVDLTNAYDPGLRALARQVAPDLAEGVYVQFPGPHYETPAEVNYAKIIGGDLVGMSTTLETIAAREAGMKVLGLSLVTNPAAGITGAQVEHSEVIQAGQNAAPKLAQLLANLVEEF